MSGPIIPSHLTWHGQPGSGTEEAQQGRRSYLECLADLHRILQPRRYLEIGIRHGRSLALASCESVGVDPDPQLEVELGRATRVVEQTSDDFFQQYQGEPFDLIFVDGMHLFECVLRDLINSERAATPNTVIVLDDVLPNHLKQARRKRETQVWTGDVWKMGPMLKKWRPDLNVAELDANPTGLIIVSGLDPKNSVLSGKFTQIVADADQLGDPPASILSRKTALSPSTGTIEKLVKSRSHGSSNTG